MKIHVLQWGNLIFYDVTTWTDFLLALQWAQNWINKLYQFVSKEFCELS